MHLNSHLKSFLKLVLRRYYYFLSRTFENYSKTRLKRRKHFFR